MYSTIISNYGCIQIDEKEQYLKYINKIEKDGKVKLITQTIKIYNVPLLVCSAEVQKKKKKINLTYIISYLSQNNIK